MVKKISAAVLCLLLVLFSAMTAYTEDNKPFTVLDDKTHSLFTISSQGEHRIITCDGKASGEVYISDIDYSSAFDNVITFYDKDSLNRQLNVYRFYPEKDLVDAFVIKENACSDTLCFKTDDKGNIYFVLQDDSEILCVYTGADTKHVEADASIKQIICDSQGKILVATSENLLEYKGESFKVISDTAYEVPLVYIKGRLFDNNNSPVFITGTVENTSPQIILPEHEFTPVDTDTPLDLNIWGDINKDSKVNSADTFLILNHLSGKSIFSSSKYDTADLNGDKTVDLKDALELSKMY